MWYLVLNDSTSGDETGGIYKSYDRAERRLEFLQKHYETDEDSWRIVPVRAQKITEPPLEELEQ